MKTITIFDTTLRDGEQSPGAVLYPAEKLLIAKKLEELGVDVIEAGFPLSSPGDFKAVEKIAKEVKNSSVCALSRALNEDVEVAWKAVKKAVNPRIHIFISSSDIHLKFQLRKSKQEVLERISSSIKLAKKYLSNIEFSPMDATRADFDYLKKCLETAINAGASTVNIPDTVGYMLPWEFENLIKKLKKSVEGIEKTAFSVHCHNDLGLATANSLAALQAGTDQIECTINGIGERAGNTSLEEIVMAIKIRKDLLQCKTRVKNKKIYDISRLVSKMTRMYVQPNKAIVGRNAFAHAAGIHQDGYLKGSNTYEIMSPEDIGLSKSRVILCARSGRHALKYRLTLLKYFPDDKDLNSLYQRFLEIADTKRIVTNKDLLAIIK